MKLREEIVELINTQDLRVLWDHFSSIGIGLADEDKKEYESIKKKVRNGINLTFDINWVLEEEFKKQYKDETIIINQTVYKLSDYWTEMQERKDLMRKVVYDNIAIEDQIKPRGWVE